jgi:hypothetical protein
MESEDEGVITVGQAHDLGWRVTAYCRWGKRDAMKSIRECNASQDLDLPTLVWTHGRAYPLSHLGTRLKCIRCGSRRVSLMFQPPRLGNQARVTALR